MLSQLNAPTTVSVFWDFENCAVPTSKQKAWMHQQHSLTANADTRGFVIVRRIKDYLCSKNLQLTNILAIGNISRMSSVVKLDLEESGVVLQNISSGKPSAADIAIMGEIMKITFFHKPPHAIILISGDRDFSKVLNFLESVNYSVTLVHSNNISDVLRYSVRDTMLWTSLIRDGHANLNPQPMTRQQHQQQHQQSRRMQTPADTPTKSSNKRARSNPPSPPARLSPSLSTSSSSSSSCSSSSDQVVFPESPERALMVLREIRDLSLEKSGNNSSSKGITTCKVSLATLSSALSTLNAASRVSGFKDIQDFSLWAHYWKWITYNTVENTIVLRNEGVNLIWRFHGYRSETILYRAPVLERNDKRFSILINCMFELNEKGQRVKRADFMPLLIKRTAEARCSSPQKPAIDYYHQALANNVIEYHTASDTVSLALTNDNQSEPTSPAAVTSDIVKQEPNENSSGTAKSSLPPIKLEDTYLSLETDFSEVEGAISSASVVLPPQKMNLQEQQQEQQHQETDTHPNEVETSRHPIPTCHVEFRWFRGGKSVVLMGSWDGWKDGFQMTMNGEGVYGAVIVLRKGCVYEFVYVVDGVSCVDENEAVVNRGQFRCNVVQL
ncbi:UNVERIFIED_CONTAM: hypothetical protein HDU68_009011 [Siphonaria sp. JEL0065]|nr:hypothetical protein HDU68_009011 [Siphonaria sp. JEL0065]